MNTPNRPRPPVPRGPWNRWRRLLAAVYVILAVAGLYDYIDARSATLVIGTLALLYAPALEKQPAGSFRFGWLSLAFMTLFFLLPLRTIATAALVCAICLYRESFFRRMERTTPFILALMTPVAGYFAETFSAPIRLQLTSLAGHLIGATGLDSKVSGNAIIFHDHLYTVDPACMGLHMFLVSLLSALLLMNYYQGRYRRRLSLGMILLLLLLTAILDIVANLMRIIFLVLLAIPQENPLHGFLGLLMLGAYVLLPLLPSIRFAIRRSTQIPPQTTGIAIGRSRRLLTANTLVGASMILFIPISTQVLKTPPATGNMIVPGYTTRRMENNILQLDNGHSLVYIKPIPGFFHTDHTPTICWQGSGYTFKEVRKATIDNIQVFEGEIQKDHQTLYTAWWYDNGIHRTTGPVDWRWDLIRGAPAYSVVNITAATQQQLETEITLALTTHPFDRLLSRPYRH